MYYTKIVIDDTVIEFHNNWLGEETVVVNGRIVSKKSSVLGTNHYFALMENGQEAHYILTTKVNDHLQILLDVSKNGRLVQEDVPVKFGSKPQEPVNESKKQGLVKLKKFALEEALEDFEKALKLNPKDPEIYFHMACAYSVLERPLEGFEALKKAVQSGLPDQEEILNHDMLAFIRLQEAFEDFLNSGFTAYDEGRVKNL